MAGPQLFVVRVCGQLDQGPVVLNIRYICMFLLGVPLSQIVRVCGQLDQGHVVLNIRYICMFVLGVPLS